MSSAISIALSGLNAATQRLNASASNIANISTAGSLDDPQNGPYEAVTTTSKTLDNGGVRADIVTTNQPFIPAYDPDSPFANAQGLIGVPAVDLATEAVNAILAELAYKANLEVIDAAQENENALLDIFDSE